ncbi:MAG TPA: hypothetical protein PK313_09050 [Myxococcota bacterium]|nr:hypothetical protein [Myxococcota bacterium]
MPENWRAGARDSNPRAGADGAERTRSDDRTAAGAGAAGRDGRATADGRAASLAGAASRARAVAAGARRSNDGVPPEGAS